MYEINYDYILKESRKQDSELVKFLLNYDDPLPMALYYLFNGPAPQFPSWVYRPINKKHYDNWSEHHRYNSFAKKGESYKKCDQRLIKELMSKTDLPIFKKIKGK